jgi:hypothetical protein
MQRFDARNHRFVWIEIRLFNPIDLIFESVCHSDGPPAAPRNRICLKWSARHSISPIEFLNHSYLFFEFVFGPAGSHAL